MNIFKITVIVFIINNAIPNKVEKQIWDGRVKAYAAQVGVDLKINYRHLKERKCTKQWGDSWEKRNAYYYCLNRYKRLKKDYNLFIRPPYLVTDEKGIVWQQGAGLASICIPKNPNGIGFAVYRSISPLADAAVAAHELFHMFGALHQELDPIEIMYPRYLTPLIEKNGGMNVNQGTKDGIKQCLSGM